MSMPEIPPLDRRTALKWMFTAAAAVALLRRGAFAIEGSTALAGHGYGTDPDLLKIYKPGDLWPLTLTPSQRKTTAVLCDLILPGDHQSPAASALNVQDFIDEWISAPYPGHDEDRKTILEGLAWLDMEADRRFGRKFTDLVYGQRAAICDDICHEPAAKADFKAAARFFGKFRDLASGGFYSTNEGMKDIGYVGNVQLAKFEGPPPEVLKILGLA